MKLKFKILLCYFIFSVFLGYGQQDTSNVQIEGIDLSSIQMETTTLTQSFSQVNNPYGSVVPPSPNASSLMRYLDYPVSNATGIPDINIPLYVIKSGELSLPISLSYHSSGRRVYDRTGAVGLGWTLNAGGMISRTIYGEADGWNYEGTVFPDPWKRDSELSIVTDFPYLASIDNRSSYEPPIYDSEYDIFSFAVNNLTGHFILKDVNNNKVPVLIPKQPYTLEYGINSTNELFDSFDIIDENGITYRFGKALTDGNIYREFCPKGYNGWLLTDIVSANKEDSIHFKYEAFLNYVTSYNTVYKKITKYFDHYYPMPYPVTEPIIPEETISTQSYTTQRLKEIKFKSGRIVFDLDTITEIPIDGNLLIKSMEIKDANDITIKKIVLNQSLLNYFTDASQMSVKKLDNIIIQDSESTPVESYNFDYYPVVYPGVTTAMNVRSMDLWGYYNASGRTDMCQFIPTTTEGQIIENTNANRNSNLTALKSGVLKKITYPTGGYSEFFYEQNQYDDQGTTKAGGGLRIYQIKTSDGNNNVQTKTYKYGNNESGVGKMPLIPGYRSMMAESERWELIEYNYGTSVLPNYKWDITVLYSNVLPKLSYFANLPVFYTYVAEYLGDEESNSGKTTYKYSEGITRTTSAQPYSGINYQLWKKSNLLKKSYYTNTGNTLNPYSLTKVISNSYAETTNPSETIYGLWIDRLYYILPLSGDEDGIIECPINYNNPILCEDGECTCIGEYYYAAEGMSIYAYGDYTIEVGKEELTTTIDSVFTNNGTIVTNTSFQYNSNHLLKERQVYNSSGDSLEFTYRYPPDINSGIYASMAGSTVNMLNFPIEQTKKVAGKWTDGILTTYKTDDGNIVPDKTYTLETAVPLNSFTEYTGSSMDSNYGDNPEMEFIDYDTNGNLLKAKGKDGIYTYYLWAYNKQYPVAKIESGTNVTLPISVNDNSLSFSDDLSDIQDDIDYLQGLLSSYIGNSSYRVTLYTYKPLIGMTSETDPAGRTIYYEYDDFGRLSLIRDQNDNIVEKYEYNYASQ